MKKKVVQMIVENQSIGGPSKALERLMNSNLKEKFEFIIVKQKAPGIYPNLKEVLRIVKILKTIKPDIVHVRGLQSEAFYGVLSCKLAGIKNIVLSVHGFYGDVLNISPLKKFIFNNIIEPIALLNAKLIYTVCTSASKRRIILKNTKNRFYGVIYNSIPSKKIISEEKLEILKNNLKIKNNDIVIVSVGRITEDKGYKILNLAIKKIFAKNSKCNLKFLVVGDGQYMNEFKKNIIEKKLENNVIFIGKTDNVEEYLSISDIFVFPTLHENLSNALLEACTYKLPSIVTNVGGNSEVVLHNKTGLVISKNNIDELVVAIKELALNPSKRKKFGENAYRHVKDNFSQEVVYSKIEEVYNYVQK